MMVPKISHAFITPIQHKNQAVHLTGKMSKNGDFKSSQPHIALFPGAGMGHLIPILRLGVMFASHECMITIITPQPTVSAAESAHMNAFFAAHPHISRLDFHILPPPTPSKADPFFVQSEAISRSVHLITPTLCTLSPPLSAIVTDFVVAASVRQIVDKLGIPNYICGTTSARFFSLLTYLPHLKLGNNDIHIPGLTPLPLSSIPPPFLDPTSIFHTVAASNAPCLLKANGILLNTFDQFESEAINALRTGKVLSDLPPVITVGPFEAIELKEDSNPLLLAWLDDQASKSVVYVSFGSRTAMSKQQMRELGSGLEKSGHKFIWVLKGSNVDKEDKDNVEDLVDEGFIERTKHQGMVIKGWVKQEDILKHPAIGGFVSHCGWNSVMEASSRGIPLMSWPQHGDQKVNAEVVEKAGLGFWVKEWGWGGEKLVNGEEIAEKIKKLIEDEKVRSKATKVGEEAEKCVMVNGSSYRALHEVIQML